MRSQVEVKVNCSCMLLFCLTRLSTKGESETGASGQHANPSKQSAKSMGKKAFEQQRT